jgi:hypothetical protein
MRRFSHLNNFCAELPRLGICPGKVQVDFADSLLQRVTPVPTGDNIRIYSAPPSSPAFLCAVSIVTQQVEPRHVSTLGKERELSLCAIQGFAPVLEPASLLVQCVLLPVQVPVLVSHLLPGCSRFPGLLQQARQLLRGLSCKCGTHSVSEVISKGDRKP